MKQYFFALGTNHSLSKIDIVNILLYKGVEFEITEASEEILIIATAIELEAEVLINELGSAAKIGKIIKKLERKNFSENRPTGQLTEKNLKEILKETLRDDLEGEIKGTIKGKKLGVSVYAAGGKLREVDRVFREIRSIGGVRESGRILSTVTVDKNKLLTDGIELVICVGSKGIYIGKTLAIQDYEGYSLRDYGRPARDDKSGMIPLKLAKIMINLAGKNKDDLLLDPFCGSGTILQEMLLLGYKNIIGADVEEKAIEDTKKNLEWLKMGLLRNDMGVKLIKSDVRTLSSKISYKTVGAVVTEPFLGSSKIKSYDLEKIKKEIKNLEELYLDAFSEFKKLLKDNGAIVIIFPIFRHKGEFFGLEIISQIREMGFSQKDFLTGQVKGEELLQLQTTKRKSVVYFRPGQTVSREIFIFKFL